MMARYNMQVPAAAYRQVLLPIVLTLFVHGAFAQKSRTTPRITQPIVESKSVALTGNTHPLARQPFDQGPAPGDLRLDRMLLVLRRSPEQETALRSLLEQQQNKSSSNYHAWLTPEQFGQHFGPAANDVQTITSWLTAHGFKVNRIARGRGIIEFSGTAGALKEAFHTEIHKYKVNGNEHWANSTDPEIPVALAPVVGGISSLYNFARKPLHRVVPRSANSQAAALQQVPSPLNPLFTSGSGCGLAAGPCYVVTPYDFATIYNVLPLWSAQSPIDGSGETIAIVAQTDIYPEDFNNFRQDFGLPAGTLNIINDGPPPGNQASQGDELEADVDVQWSGSVAKGATIDLVASASTNTTPGVDLSALYIVDNNVAPILSESYGACELDMGAAGNLFYSQLWEQAAAEGISVFVSTGDSGSAVCDQGIGIAQNGLSVSGIASTPYDTAVGGTDFADFQTASNYWSSTNNSVTHASAKGYVPESTWNDTCTNTEFYVFTGDSTADAQCNDNASQFWPGYLYPAGGSGGASSCIAASGSSPASCSGGYLKPSWQAGPGVPNDGKRDLPDVSLFAADGMNSSFYLACETDIYGGCAGQIDSMVALGGTSVSSPEFAGIMALIDQKTHSRQGNANFRLYPLAAQAGASCNSTGNPGSSCIFYDVTTGTIAMPCVSGSPNCVTAKSTDLYGLLSGYPSTSGYDLATGLGSVNVANLVNNWNSVSFTPTVSTLSLSPTNSIPHGSSVAVNIAVSPQSGTGSPSGMVSLLTSTGRPAGVFTLANGAVSSTTSILPGGSYSVSAHYAGDGTYAASDSTPGIPVTVTPEASITTLQALTFDNQGNALPYSIGPYGAGVIYVQATVAGQSGNGIATGTVNLTQTLNGVTGSYSGDPYSLTIEGSTIAAPPTPPLRAYAPGTYSIHGAYSGDSSFNASKGVTTFTVSQAPTATAIPTIVPCPQSGTCSIQTGTPVTIFANVNNPSSPVGNLPTGTVTFYSNGVPLGPPATVDSSIVPAVASINTSQLAAGADNITAQYSGDVNYLASASPIALISVGQTFTLAASPTLIHISSPGQSGSTTLTFTAQNGFTGTTTLTAAMCSNLPTESKCSFSPASIALTASTRVVPVTLTITTTPPSSQMAASLKHNRLRPLAWEFSGMFIFGICVVRLGSRRRRTSLLLFTLLWIAVSIACGGGGTSAGGGPGGSGSGGGGGDPGTTVGSYNGVTVTVTMNGVTQSINNLSVNIQ